jgi:hypothetical protein
LLAFLEEGTDPIGEGGGQARELVPGGVDVFLKFPGTHESCRWRREEVLLEVMPSGFGEEFGWPEGNVEILPAGEGSEVFAEPGDFALEYMFCELGDAVLAGVSRVFRFTEQTQADFFLFDLETGVSKHGEAGDRSDVDLFGEITEVPVFEGVTFPFLEGILPGDIRRGGVLVLHLCLQGGEVATGGQGASFGSQNLNAGPQVRGELRDWPRSEGDLDATMLFEEAADAIEERGIDDGDGFEDVVAGLVEGHEGAAQRFGQGAQQVEESLFAEGGD